MLLLVMLVGMVFVVVAVRRGNGCVGFVVSSLFSRVLLLLLLLFLMLLVQLRVCDHVTESGVCGGRVRSLPVLVLCVSAAGGVTEQRVSLQQKKKQKRILVSVWMV